jgi:hypothetical protein
MVCYTVSKPPSAINFDWIFWSKNDHGQSIAPHHQIKKICVIYKPTPVFNDKDKPTAIIGNMFNESSLPAFFQN